MPLLNYTTDVPADQDPASRSRPPAALEALRTRLDNLAAQAPDTVPDWYVAPPLVDDMRYNSAEHRRQAWEAHRYFAWAVYWALQIVNQVNQIEVD